MSALGCPNPPLSDGVVSLRPFRDTDASVAAAWCRDAAIVRWSGAPANHDENSALAWAAMTDTSHGAGDVLALVITDTASGAALGSVDLRRPSEADLELGEVGFFLGPEARGRGIATRSTRLLLTYAFDELGIARVQALVHPENPASAKVLERLGFRREGLLRDHRVGAEGREDRILFSLPRPRASSHGGCAGPPAQESA
jgi:RimJ/RimL family protein N-acetyltransferase